VRAAEESMMSQPITADPAMPTAPSPSLNGRGTPLVEVREASKVFVTGGLFDHKETYAVDGVNLTFPGDRPTIISLVGESGSGKTTLARLILGLAEPTSGRIFYQGRDIHRLSGAERRIYRQQVQAVFQDPYAIYNPFYQVDRVLRVAVRKFGLARSRHEEQALLEEALRAVDLRPHDVLGRYPHQLSGGERQRVMLARLFLLKPRLIVADEPVSMLDAAVRAMFLNILLDFRDKLGISTLFITHNLATANYLGGEIMVLYRGRVVEQGSIDAIIAEPKHPYAQTLLDSVPIADPRRRWGASATLAGEEVRVLPGRERCLFAERCPRMTERCLAGRPRAIPFGDGREVACTLYG
jgi:peptide/nickel transport system ATP-binding protein